MPVSLTSPDTGNYYIGKGICSFKNVTAGESEFRDLGNVPEAEITLEIEELEHFSSRVGTRSKDLVVVLEKGGAVRFVMEEFTPENAILFFLGGQLDELAVGGPTFDILSENAVEGEWKFHGTNDVGPNWDVHLHNVRIIPSGSINLIGEEWGTIEVNAEMLISQTTGKFGIVTLTNLSAS